MIDAPLWLLSQLRWNFNDWLVLSKLFYSLDDRILGHFIFSGQAS